MPRVNVWLNDDQVSALHHHLGKGVNISGCIRAGFSLLLDTLAAPDRRSARRSAALLGELDGLVERAEAQLSDRAKARVRARRPS